ncbi:type VI-A CRISPR-associated RNA-guided ribonuclease Cas13a (plasmid) [Leptotrichia sp. HSP-334]|uniref:CRISPR-associated endoribonuclease Cas13a n=1 Tax=Leptotrichia rugosa TaxID=3239302 RepID=A0AB39VIT5_9FUSO
MKVTKIDGLSHKKFEDEGKLVKFRNNKNINEIKERLKKLKELKLDNYIKNPENVKNKDKDAEKETKIRRTNLKKYFSEIILRKEDEKYILKKTKKFKDINQEIDYYDVKSKKNQQEIFDVLKEILELKIKETEKEEIITFDSEKLKKVFGEDFVKKEAKIKAIEKSLKINKANYKKDSIKIGDDKYSNVKGENKRSRVYEYYKKSETHEKFRKNIIEAFEKLYTEENIKELYSKIEEVFKKTHLKSIVREFYQNEIIGESEFSKKDENGKSILYNQIEDSIKKDENFVEFLENIENLQLKELTKSQIFYKYFLENEELDDENIKNVFCYFVEIEVNNLLRVNVYKASKIYQNKIKNIFGYNKLKKLIVYKLENKLNNYVRNCGKYNYHMENGDIATSDINMRNRQTEAFLRSIIGVSSFGYFSLRNILGVNDDDFYETEEDLTKKERRNLEKAKEDITIKNTFDEVVVKSFQKKGIYNIKENLKMFYGDSFDNADKDELKQFFVNMLNAITSIRHRVVHYNMNTNSENIFNFSGIEVSKLLKSIFEKETDKRELKLKIFRQLNSAGVFDYWENRKIDKYLENIEFKFVNKNIPFVPSFTKLYNRIDNLKGNNALNLGYINIPKRKEARDSQIYLLKNIYYGEFVEKFVNNNDNFEKIFKEIIEINKKAGTNTKTKFYKLEKFETLKANTPTEYLEKLQSLHEISYDKEKIEEDKDIYVDFVQKIFLKGFVNYLKKLDSLKSLNLLNLKKDEVITDKKSFYDEKLKLWENSGSNLSKMPKEIYDYIKKIKINKINYSDRMSIFYLLLKLIDYRELTNLRGNLEKYESMNKNEIYSEELTIINLVNLDNNKVRTNFSLEAEDIGKFLKTETSIRNINQLNNFSEIFADGENVIKHRSFYNIKKYGILDLLEKIVDKADLKITKEEIKKYENLQNELKRNDFYKIQERIHRNYNQKPFLIKNNEKDFNDYKKAIENIQNYTQLKNKIEFNDLNLLQSLLFRILHRLAGYTSLWERDLQFKLKGEYPENKYIDEIFNFDNSKNKIYNEKNERGGSIVSKYGYFLAEKDGEIQESRARDKKKKKIIKKEGLEIRNYIAHFNYIPDATKSILEILEELRELLKYDRKLKNAVMKSIKDIFREYGFIVEFTISHTKNGKEIKVCSVKSEKIKHLKNNELITTRNSEDLCDLVKIMLEYKELQK